MQGNAVPFVAQRAGGVRHAPEADIESIRDLLRGYGAAGSILKELIQNAEDAGATRMNLIYLPKDPAAPHPLLRAPSLLAANNGAFRPEHRDAITQINLGTKGTEERAIGRFGKGLKSAFAWCEAFFIIAHTNHLNGWPDDASFITDFFNPWHNWRHEEWVTAFNEYAAKIRTKAEEQLSNIHAPAEPWLAFWFPLRSRLAEETNDEWIHHEFPGEDSGFGQMLGRELRALAPSLVFLRNLQQIAVVNRDLDASEASILEFSPNSRRIPAPGDLSDDVSLLGGEIELRSGGGNIVRHQYIGLAGQLAVRDIQDIKQRQDWPRIAHRNNGQLHASAPIKGEPHFATMISAHPVRDDQSTGTLNLRWCVFFPIGKPPEGANELPIPLPTLRNHITINLHGFFFLDSERLRIDGLENRFESRDAAVRQWNHTVATRGALAQIPKALAAFAEEQKLTAAECRALAEAFRQTWAWKSFQKEICQLEQWRPRWHWGRETWECLSTEKPTLFIPKPSHAPGISEHIPQLNPISEENILVVKDDDGALPGLYFGAPSPWPEGLGLRLLRNINLEADATAKWINDFLDHLHEQGTLSEPIREEIADMPLLAVRDARTNRPQRLSARQWADHADKELIVTHAAGDNSFLASVCRALPDWNGFVCARQLPLWFNGPLPAACDEKWAARTVLGQERFAETLHRIELIQKFASLEQRSPEMRLAMRLLLHCTPAERRNPASHLFLGSQAPNALIWSRILEQIFAQIGDKAWRLLPGEWSGVLTQQIQNELEIVAIDAKGVLKELQNGNTSPQALDFSTAEWREEEISSLQQGLFQAGYPLRLQQTLALLRKLPLHKLRGNPDQRISIADPAGNLEERFILDAPNFDAAIPIELQSLWRQFLSESRIVIRLPNTDLAAAIQPQLFQGAELNWSLVVRHCQQAENPHERAGLILHAFAAVGDQAAAGIGNLLKEAKWLPLELGGAIAPADIVHFEGLETELHQLLDPQQDGLGGILSLAAWVREHSGFSTLQNYLPRPHQAMEILGLWLEEKPDWRLGLTGNFSLFDLESILAQVENIGNLPGASLLIKLHRTGQTQDITNHILPPLLKSFEPEDRLRSLLLRLCGISPTKAFEAYLHQACIEKEIKNFLPELRLPNQLGEWIPASQLIWPSANLNPAAQLKEEFAQILAPFLQPETTYAPGVQNLQSVPGQMTRFQLNEAPNFEAEAEHLVEYLQPFRNGSIGDNLPAALVAVLGGHPKIQNLLQELLQSELKQAPEHFRARLLGGQSDFLAGAMAHRKFLVEIIRNDEVEARTITGETTVVALTPEIESLLVGATSDLYSWCTYQDQPQTACHWLRLRWIERPDELSDPTGVFASTIEAILLKVHCNGVAQQVPPNIRDFLDEIAQTGQADLRRSQLYLLDLAESRLQELGMKGVPFFDQLIKQFADARQARVDAKDLFTRNHRLAAIRKEEEQRLLDNAKEKLLRALENPNSTEPSRELVRAVQRKMANFQYGIESIPLELFQNADDAVSESAEAQGGVTSQEKEFRLSFDGDRKALDIIHWGRPINRHSYPGFNHGITRGYDQDLQKMLTLNYSDKGSSDQTNLATGRFGLGFKSVFFLSDRPQVLSGRLAFEIRGGFFPVPLSAETVEDLRSGIPWNGATPTIIRLHFADDAEENKLDSMIEKFKAVAPLLTLFSRQIDKLSIAQNQQTTLWTKEESNVTACGRVTKAVVGNKHYLCFRCEISSDARPATVLFQLDSNGISALAQELTGIWVTTPTAERSDFRFAINAPLKPDAGRQRLALQNTENRKIARELAASWGEALLALFDKAHTGWQEFAAQLNLHANASVIHWWKQIWTETTRGTPILKWEDLNSGNQLPGWIAWGDPDGAMRSLLQERPAIPSDLPDAYGGLIKLSDIRYCTSGLLSEDSNGCFTQVSQWESMQREFPPGQIVHEKVATFLRQVSLGSNIEPLKLQKILAREVGPDYQVTPMIGDRLGSLLQNCPLLFDQSALSFHETQELLAWMRQLHFKARDGAYHPASKLVCDRPGSGIDRDETLRSGFAPRSAILAEEYSSAALAFFIKSRGQISAGSDVMAQWIQSCEPEQFPAVFNYLVSGELGQSLAGQLGAWFDSMKRNPIFRGLPEGEQYEIVRKFAKGRHDLFTRPIIEDPPPPEELPISPEQALSRISNWWSTHQFELLEKYHHDTYPTNFPLSLPWPGEDEWDSQTQPSAQARWLLLFIQAALVPLGFNKIGRDQGFSRFLVSSNWLHTFTKVATQPEAVLKLLDRYLDSYIQNTQFHFQLRQFIAFYAVAKNLEPILFSLYEAEKSDNPQAFERVFSPRANPLLIGTGIDSPPLTGLFGMGACHLLRELYRLKRLKNPNGYPYAFTPLRKVRRLCGRLFQTPEESLGAQSSKIIFTGLKNLCDSLVVDPTFNCCFDLPFQILAEDAALRSRVLEQELSYEDLPDFEADEDYSLWSQ